jgi:hypothetical protein
MKRRAGHNMLTISHLALALPRATAFTNYRRRFQPRVVLRGMGTEQLGAVAAPGVRVRAPWRNGQLYPGQVTSVEGDKVSIKFDDGDKREGVTWNDCAVGPADDMPEPAVGLRVMAPWKNRHMYPGRVGAVSKSKDKVKINFDDDDELVVPWTACRLRDAPRTSYKRPQSLSDSLSYAGLTDSQLKPRAQPAHESALKLVGVWKSTSVSRAPDNSSLSHFSATTWPRWLHRPVRNRHRHAVEQASRRWRGGRRGDSARTRRKI